MNLNNSRVHCLPYHMLRWERKYQDFLRKLDQRCLEKTYCQCAATVPQQGRENDLFGSNRIRPRIRTVASSC